MLAIVRQDFLGHTEGPQGGGQGQADRPAGGPLGHRGHDAVPGMVIDPGHHLGFAQVPGALIGDHDAADDVDLPQLHRARAFPATVTVPGPFPRPGRDQPLPGQDPVDGPLRRHQYSPRAAQQFQPDPFRTPLRMLAAHLRHGDLGITRHLMRARLRPVGFISQPGQPFGQIPGHPAMD